MLGCGFQSWRLYPKTGQVEIQVRPGQGAEGKPSGGNDY
jgi:hypothetical protein